MGNHGAFIQWGASSKQGYLSNAPCLGQVQRQDQITLCGESGTGGLIPDAFSLGESIVLMTQCSRVGQLGAGGLIV